MVEGKLIHIMGTSSNAGKSVEIMIERNSGSIYDLH